MAATTLRSQLPFRPGRENKGKALTRAGPRRTCWGPGVYPWPENLALHTTALEAQAPRGAPRGFPAQTGPVLRPGRLGSWRCAPGPLPASQRLGVHATELGEGRGAPPQSESRGGDTAPKRVQLVGEGWTRGPARSIATWTLSPQVPQAGSARQRIATKVKQTHDPYQPHRASRSFCPSVPARGSPAS